MIRSRRGKRYSAMNVVPLPGVDERTAPANAPHLLSGGFQAFDRILERIDAAKKSVLMRCFDWRDDETGMLVGEAVLKAADRGIKVTILKDLVGANYEYFEGNNQSFFHKKIPPVLAFQTRFLQWAYRCQSPLDQHANPLSEAILRHPNVVVERHRERYDHSKVYIFDDDVLIVGGMGVGDDFRLHNVDFMVEIACPDAVRRFRDRWAARVPFDPSRALDFIVHTRDVHGSSHCPLLGERLSLMGGARERLSIEMAYLGDRRYTDAMVAAVQRGVQLTLVTAARANILGDLNLSVCDELLKRTGSPDHLRVVLHPQMVHSKVIVVDGHLTDIGSANFTRLTHGVYDEVNLCYRSEAFAADVEDIIESHVRQGRRVHDRVPHSRFYREVERAIVAYQSRHAV